MASGVFSSRNSRSSSIREIGFCNTPGEVNDVSIIYTAVAEGKELNPDGVEVKEANWFPVQELVKVWENKETGDRKVAKGGHHHTHTVVGRHQKDVYEYESLRILMHALDPAYSKEEDLDDAGSELVLFG